MDDQIKSINKDPRLTEIMHRLVDLLHPERIYLFGSRAREESRPDADFDLMIIVPDDAPPEHKRGRLAYQRLWDLAVAADILVWTKSQFESRKHVVSSLPATVLREGVLIYES
jgi:predicted nucleotidyltransferase